MDITCDITIQTTVQKPCFQQWGDTLVMGWTHGTNNLRYHLGCPVLLRMWFYMLLYMLLTTFLVVAVYTGCRQREGYIPELATVLERLSTAGLTLELKKCVFATKSLGYLGHVLGCDGTVYGEVRSFIIPLTKLLRKKTEWGWSTDQETTFTTLTIRQLLVYSNFSVPFRLNTDASKPSLGACLIQDCGDKSRPVTYASKVNRPAEETTGATVVWAIKLFRPYHYGRRFTISTDHIKMVYVKPNLTGKLHRWALALQKFKGARDDSSMSTEIEAACNRRQFE
ncbi:LOW QUALITY PROTEIN: Gag-pol fusion protein [Phytophthora palmivora]|uniref:Gag-pol fusion protein n=1 Tax=Phytophthora palmivora TaxID=4796 RepID=A0A2P4YT48_9STRA|nr:LOW QUALITY PROTEIN: Gag-pol fusion protein [Phytophthora palmivora]